MFSLHERSRCCVACVRKTITSCCFTDMLCCITAMMFPRGRCCVAFYCLLTCWLLKFRYVVRFPISCDSAPRIRFQAAQQAVGRHIRRHRALWPRPRPWVPEVCLSMAGPVLALVVQSSPRPSLKIWDVKRERCVNEAAECDSASYSWAKAVSADFTTWGLLVCTQKSFLELWDMRRLRHPVAISAPNVGGTSRALRANFPSKLALSSSSDGVVHVATWPKLKWVEDG